MKDSELKNIVITAKALRSAFCRTKNDLLTGYYMSDNSVLESVREMQEQHKIFSGLCNKIKEADEAVYDKEILGIDHA